MSEQWDRSPPRAHGAGAEAGADPAKLRRTDRLGWLIHEYRMAASTGSIGSWHPQGSSIAPIKAPE